MSSASSFFAGAVFLALALKDRAAPFLLRGGGAAGASAADGARWRPAAMASRSAATSQNSAILAAIAELERSIIKERVVAGLAKAKANGTRLGRPRTGFDVQKAVELKLAGHTWSQIAEVVGASSATLRRMIPGLLKYPEEDGATVPAQ